MEHTKEPWISVPGGRFDYEMLITTQHRVDQGFGAICGMDVEFTGKHGEEQKANLRRIVACVNACAGKPTELLELAAEFDAADEDAAWEPPHPIFRMASNIDQLLAALEGMLASFVEVPATGSTGDATDKAYAAIASVKGGAA